MSIFPTIRAAIDSSLPGLFNVPAKLHVFTAATRTTPPSYTTRLIPNACFMDRKQIGLRGAGLVQAEESAAVFFKGRLPSDVTLKVNDEVTVTDERGTDTRYKLVRLADEDPAEATQTWAVVEVAA